jgi:hypothetical protein
MVQGIGFRVGRAERPGGAHELGFWITPLQINKEGTKKLREADRPLKPPHASALFFGQTNQFQCQSSPTTLETTQGQTDGFFSQIPFRRYLPEVASVGD